MGMLRHTVAVVVDACPEAVGYALLYGYAVATREVVVVDALYARAILRVVGLCRVGEYAYELVGEVARGV